MLSNFPPELIIECLHYLSFGEVETLAWTNRRMMQIVRRNLQPALMPRLQIREIGVTHRSYTSIEDLMLTIDWASSRRSSTYLPFFIRPEEEKQKYAEDDEKLYAAFLRFYKAHSKHYNRLNYDFEWYFEDYAVHVEKLAEDEWHVPPLPLHLLLYRADICKLSLIIADPVLLASTLSVLDTSRTTIKEKDIDLDMKITAEVKKMIDNSNFFKRGITNFHMEPSPFTKELLQMPQFVDTKWSMFKLNASVYEMIIQLGIRRIQTVGNNMNLIGFLTKLFEAAPLKRDWCFQCLFNNGSKWDWSSIEKLLDRFNMRYRIMKEVTEQPKSTPARKKRSFSDRLSTSETRKKEENSSFVKEKHYKIYLGLAKFWYLKISIENAGFNRFNLEIC